MSEVKFKKNQIICMTKAIKVSGVNIPINTRGVVSKGGVNPHIELLLSDKILAISTSAVDLQNISVEAKPIIDEALKEYSVKKVKFATGQETNEIYLELYKGRQLVATGHNNGCGEGNYLSYMVKDERKNIDKFIDSVAVNYPEKQRFILGENFVHFLALYFSSGFCSFDEFVKAY